MKCHACDNHATWLVAHTTESGQRLGGRPACDDHVDSAWPDATEHSTLQYIAQPPAEPGMRGDRWRDSHGDIWVKGTTRWTCTAKVDNVRVHTVGRLRWADLWRQYGPLTPE